MEHVLLLDQKPAPDLEQGSIFFVGTATVLLRYAGFTILTDPNFLHQGQKVYLGMGLHSTRQTEPGMRWEDLPPIDFVLLSHLHEDHFDREVARRLHKDVPIVTTKKAARELDRQGFHRTFGLDTWDSINCVRVGSRARITAMPGVHAPGPFRFLLPPVMGSMIEFEHGPVGSPALYRVYVSGDTLLHDDLNRIPERYPGIDLGLFHLGGTRIFGLLKVTMDGQDGVRALEIVAPDLAIPVHYDDYDVFKSPLSDFQIAVRRAGLEHKVRYLSRGSTYAFTVPEQRRRLAA